MRVEVSLSKGFERLYEEYCKSEKGKKLLDLEGISLDKIDFGKMSMQFFREKLSDIAIDANSNMTGNSINPTSYRTHTTNGGMKLLGYETLWDGSDRMFGSDEADRLIRAVWDGELYFHDAHGVKIQMPYCFAFSLDKLVLEGRQYGPSPNTPPKRRKSFLSQVDKLISDLSKQFAGATAPSDLLFWYAYFCKLEGLDVNNPDHVKEMENDLQGLVCLFNEPSRAEGESPFVNIGIYDKIGLEQLFGHILYPDFTKPDLEYVMEIQKIFCRWFSNGDPITGFPYRFPVVTLNITTGDNAEFVDEETAKEFASFNRGKGNFNIHFGDKTKLAMCCRYENDLEDMNMSPDSFGNGGVNIGSHRVVTINMPRAALMADNDMDKLFKNIDDQMEKATKLLLVHRYEILQRTIKNNPQYLQFFGSLKWFNLDTMFSTFGITGVYETCDIMGYDIMTDDGAEFAYNILQHVKDNVKRYRQKYGVVFNVEEIPGEQACVTMVNKDRVSLGVDIPYQLYSNQYIPLVKKVNMITRFELAGKFMSLVSGGGIVHNNVDSEVDTVEKEYEMMKFAAKCRVTHMAKCHRFGSCENGHVNIVAQAKVCPVCGKPIISARQRVIGYFSDEGAWNPIRRKVDAPNRKFNKISELIKQEEGNKK